VAFNLRKFAAAVPEMDASQSVLTGLERAEDTFEPQESVEIDDQQVLDSAQNAEQETLLNQAKNLPLINQLQELLSMPDYAEIAPVVREQPEIKALVDADDLTALRDRIDQLQLGPTVQQFEKSNDRLVQPDELKNYLDRIKTTVETQKREQSALQQQRQTLFPAASKRAQVSPPDPVDESGKGLFVQQYLDTLLAFRGDKGEQDAAAEEAKQEILAAVSPMLQNDANDALEAIEALNPHERDRAEHFLALVFENFVAPAALEPTQMEQPVMSKHNPKGIIKFNLSDHILNNAENQEKMTKTARMHSDDAYLLYGPTEKRICPKLRGKGVGDVVSEYICRHHCLDGIVIDDNKTICGEALWRANAMDKFSREYVDADGEIKGGYINKRFEINRNVPEENKMRLKPGETRKPRPASIYGNMEARMQEMREKEGKKRGYAPDTDTSEPFGWCHDVDQNNVEQTQKERNRREEAAGHKLAPGQGSENKPKKGFNLKQHKTAAEKCPCGCGQDKGECKCHEDPDQGKSYSAYINDKNRKENWTDKKAAVENDKVVKVQVKEFDRDPAKQSCKSCGEVTKSFNLKQHKQLSKEAVDWDMVRDLVPKNLGEAADFAKRLYYAFTNFISPINKDRKLRDIESEVRRTTEELTEMLTSGNLSSSYLHKAHQRMWALSQRLFKPDMSGDFTNKDRINGILGQYRNLIYSLYWYQRRQENNQNTDLTNPTGISYSNDWRGASKTAQGAGIPVPDDGKPIEPKEKKRRKDDDLSREDLVEAKKKKEKGVTYKGEHYDTNPWAVCHTTVDKDEDPEKYERCVHHVKDKSKTSFNLKSHKEAKSPPGFKTTVEKMKEDHSDEIDNPFALAWWMKNKGHESHYNDKTKKKKEKFKDEDKSDKKSDKKSSSDRTFAEAYKDAYLSEEFCGGVAPHGYVGSSKKKT